MAARRLSTFVHVDGVAYGPEDDVPAEVAERITAPGVWADEVSDEAADDDEKSDGEESDDGSADEPKTARRKPAAKSAAGDDKG